jgi:macrodomain Ter protein organizer (MatP/YcbG family)
METATRATYDRRMAKTKDDDVRVTVRLSRAVWQQLRIYAFKEGKTLQELFERCAADHLKAHKQIGGK